MKKHTILLSKISIFCHSFKEIKEKAKDLDIVQQLKKKYFDFLKKSIIKFGLNPKEIIVILSTQMD